MVMAQRNYKVYADLGLHTQFMVQYYKLNDTETGPNFVVKSGLPAQLQAQIRANDTPDIADKNNHSARTVGNIALVIMLGLLMVKLEFIGYKCLAAPVILVCEYCDRLVLCHTAHLKQVELEDGTVIPMVQHPLKRATKWQFRLPAAQKSPPAVQESTKLWVA